MSTTGSPADTPQVPDPFGRLLFQPGYLTATPEVIALAAAHEPTGDGRAVIFALLTRHLRGDFGEVDDDDRKLNNVDSRTGGRVLSAYTLPCEKSDRACEWFDHRVWIDTAHGHQATAILRPEEY